MSFNPVQKPLSVLCKDLGHEKNCLDGQGGDVDYDNPFGK